MQLDDVLLFAALLAPIIALTELSRWLLSVSAPTQQRKAAIGITLGTWRPWFYGGGLVGLIGSQAVDMPWRAIVYVAALAAIVLLSALVAARAKDREEVEH